MWLINYIYIYFSQSEKWDVQDEDTGRGHVWLGVHSLWSLLILVVRGHRDSVIFGYIQDNCVMLGGVIFT